MVLLASTFDQSRFLRAEDVPQEKTVRIKSVTEEAIGAGAEREKKLVVRFTNTDKGLVLNRTNNRTIRAAYGDDTAGWAGKLIVVFQTPSEFKGRLVPALRVRIPPPKQASGNGQTVKPTLAEEPVSRPAPAAGQPVFDDMDDEIGF
jgi:hypothetical protein